MIFTAPRKHPLPADKVRRCTAALLHCCGDKAWLQVLSHLKSYKEELTHEYLAHVVLKEVLSMALMIRQLLPASWLCAGHAARSADVRQLARVAGPP